MAAYHHSSYAKCLHLFAACLLVFTTHAVATIPAAPAPYNAIGNVSTLVTQAEINATDLVGSVSGSFRVNESGAATYSIPIGTATGTAGVVPQISLNYSSGAGNGLMGLGWSVSGLSAVTRCRQTLHQDNAALPITWSGQDRFCLDGQRLLVASGAYGAPGSTYKTETDSFTLVTAVGGATGNPAYFQIERKDGSVSQYGNTADSRLEAGSTGITLSWAINKFQDSVGNPIWFVYTKDADGQRINEIRYAYGSAVGPTGHAAKLTFVYGARNDPIVGYIAGHPFKTGKLLTSVKSWNGATELRNYKLNYATAHSSDKLSRLASVQECHGTACLPATSFTWTLPQTGFATSYTSQVTMSTQADRTVTDYKMLDINGDGRLDLAWNEPDWDNDGQIHDQYGKYVLANNSGGFGAVQQFYADSGNTYTPFKLAVIDYNADGRQDVLVYMHSVWKVFLSAPQSDGSWKLSNTPITTALTAYSYVFADVNADGLVDAVRSWPKANGDFAISVNYLERNTSQPLTSSQYYHFGTAQIFDWQVSQDDPVITTNMAGVFTLTKAAGDLNGDGIVDVLTDEGTHIYSPPYVDVEMTWAKLRTLNAKDQKFSFYHTIPAANATASSPHELADINGDGLADALQVDMDTSTGMVTWYFALNTGAGFATKQSLGITYSAAIELKPAFVDYNNDGYQDIYWHDHTAARLKVMVWNPATGTFDAPMNVRTTNGDKKFAHILMDMTGDGVVDYVYFYNNKLETYPGNGANQATNLVTKITNGLGAITDIAYETLSGSAHYERLSVGTTSTQTEFCYNTPYGSGCAPYTMTVANTGAFYSALNGGWTLPSGSQTLGETKPVLELSGPIRVVTRIDSSAPKDSNYTAKSAVEYFYAQARIQASGRGYLGFEKLKTRDMQTMVQTTTTYRQDWPFIGYPLRTEVRTNTGILLSESDNTWKLKNWQTSWPATVSSSGSAALGAVQPFIEKSVEKTYDLSGGALLQTVTTDNVYDNYGNPTSITVTTDGNGNSLAAANANFQKVTTNVYGTTPWDQEKGRLSQTTVVSKRDDDNNGSYEKTSTRTSSFTYYTSGVKKGLLNTETIEPGNSALSLITTHSYDNFGNKVRAATNGGGTTRCNVDTAVYDALGRYVDTTYDCLGRKTSSVVSRNAYGSPLEVKTFIHTNGVNAATTYYRYTPRGIRYFEASSTGAWQATILDACSLHWCPTGAKYLSRTRTAGGGDSREFFDVLGRNRMSTAWGFDGVTVFTETQYDHVGRVSQKSEPFLNGGTPDWNILTYDLLSRVTNIRLPDMSNSSTAYTGFTTTLTNAKGQQKAETKNALGETVQVIDNATAINNATSSTVTYTYDAQGNLATTKDSANNTVTLTYDLLGRKTAMSDPDKGSWSYQYNRFGELTLQTDAKAQTSTMTYDGLGRMVTRIDRRANNTIEANTTWTYDTAANGLGQLNNVQDSISGYIKAVEYDSFGRASKTVTSLGVGGADGNHYEKVTYDQFSRPFQTFDAARTGDTYTDNGVEHRYNSYGYHHQLVDAFYVSGNPRAIHREILSLDARGNVTGEKLANNVTTSRTFNNQTGRISNITSTTLGSTLGNIQKLSYTWDTVGNLLGRIEQSGSKNLSEAFTYDGLNRLLTQTVVGQTAKTVAYNSIGNITNKSDVGAYSYGTGTRPHAVTSAGGVTYTYDANGNNISSSDGRTITYTSFDQAQTVSKGGHTTTFAYGPDRQRYKRIDTKSGSTRTTLYIGSVEKITEANGTKKVKRYIGGVMIETESYTSGGSLTGEVKHYLFKDHLGSMDVIADQAGAILANGGELSFDAWGQRRSGVNWSDVNVATLIANYGVFSSVAPPTARGFTGHEMVDDVGIIHMNGRIYDPKLGRFLQADPFVQSPTDSQMYNRYSYTRNNPLNATDPSGYFVQFFVLAIQIAASYGAATAAITWGTAAFIAGTAAAFGTLVQGGSLGDAFLAGISAAALTYVGGKYFPTGEFGLNAGTAKYAAGISVIGGIGVSLQGGNFGHGFVSAGLGVIAGGAIKLGQSTHFTIKAGVNAIIGGTLSKITGGKFANGAAYAAFATIVSSAFGPKAPKNPNGTSGTSNQEATEHGDWRYLTDGEKKMLLSEGLNIRNIDEVRIYNSGYMGAEGQVMAPNGHIYVGSENRAGLAWSVDYSSAGLVDQSIIIHEAVHVFEARAGCNTLCMGWRRLSNSSYNYEITPGKAFTQYGMEQRALMYQDRFLLRNGLNAWNSHPVTLREINTLVTTPKM